MALGDVRPAIAAETRAMETDQVSVALHQQLAAAGAAAVADGAIDVGFGMHLVFRGYRALDSQAYAVVYLSPMQDTYLEWTTWFTDGSSLTTSATRFGDDPARPADMRLNAHADASLEALTQHHEAERLRLQSEQALVVADHPAEALLPRLQHAVQRLLAANQGQDGEAATSVLEPVLDAFMRTADSMEWSGSGRDAAPEAEDDAAFQVAGARGVNTFDVNGVVVFARAGVEATAAAWRAVTGAPVWEENIAGRLVTLTEHCWIVGRLTGHAWSMILPRKVFEDGCPDPEDAAALSRRLGADTLYYLVSETAEVLEYLLFHEGEVAEELHWSGQTFWSYAERLGQETPEPAVSAEGSFSPGLRFESALRTVPDDEIEGDPYTFVDGFFRWVDAFEPGLTFSQFVGHVMHRPGDRRVLLPYDDDQFERVDFLAREE